MTDLFASPLVRFAVVGLGLMGQRHCEVIAALPEAELVAVCDHDGARASQISVVHGVDATTAYDELIEREDIEAVVICLPSAMHAEFGIRAARQGKHVIVEKPIDSRSASAKKLAATCHQAGVRCIVINQNRYSRGLAALKFAVHSGIMGKPVLARATVKWFRHDDYYVKSTWRGRKEGEFGGVLINQAVHSIDTLQWLFGKPDQVSGFVSRSRPDIVEMEDNAVAILKWGCGLLATLEASTSSAPGFDEAYEVQSSIASIVVEKGRVVYWYHKDGLTLPEPFLEEYPDRLDAKLGLFYRQYLEILSSIWEMPNDLSTPAEAISVVETIEGIYEAAGV